PAQPAASPGGAGEEPARQPGARLFPSPAMPVPAQQAGLQLPSPPASTAGDGGSLRVPGRGPSPAVPPDARLGPSPPAFLGFEGKNRYEVRNTLGQPVFRAEEQSDCCTRHCCGSLRRFSLRLDDPAGREVLRMVRPLKCVSCWFPCCLQELEVQCPPGTTIGFVQQTWHPFTPKFSIQNVEKETVLRVLGPCFACSCGGDVNFEVKTRDESRGVGRIAKQWSGLVQEVFTDTDNFGVQFPMDLDVKIKAVLLGACFLIVSLPTEERGHGPSTPLLHSVGFPARAGVHPCRRPLPPQGPLRLRAPGCSSAPLP
uniref:Phospholipid scramblase n=1 Tax=Varanus komodoensis TaxID=61221 RepID=A0A8D2LEC1_VARKO